MPNRMLRDWTQSDKIDRVSCESERFFIRLIMKVDDYGCFWADTRLLKANLFPYKLDIIRDADILRWLTECQKAGLIVVYEIKGKKYLQIVDFKQRLDKAKAKYPLPGSEYSLTIVNGFPAEEKGSRSRREVEVELPPSPFDSQLKADTLFIEQTLMGWSTNKQALFKMIDSFFLEQKVKGKKWKDYHDFKTHFFSWGKYNGRYEEFKPAKKKMVD